MRIASRIALGQASGKTLAGVARKMLQVRFMPIGILGSGRVGRALGAGLVRVGRDVIIGSREPGREELRAWAERMYGGISVSGIQEAAELCTMAIVAVPWSAVSDTANVVGAAPLRSKVVIDATNPVVFASPREPKFALNGGLSGGEMVQHLFPESFVVKAFNSIAHTHMVHPVFPDGLPDMLICGDDDKAKGLVSELCQALGWATIDVGGISSSRYLEGLGMLGVLVSQRMGSNDHAFTLLRKEPDER